MTCIVCDRKSPSVEICHTHLIALRNVVSKLDEWKVAVGCGWAEYLDRISHLDKTGGRAKEVTRWLLSMHISFDEAKRLATAKKAIL